MIGDDVEEADMRRGAEIAVGDRHLVRKAVFVVRLIDHPLVEVVDVNIRGVQAARKMDFDVGVVSLADQLDRGVVARSLTIGVSVVDGSVFQNGRRDEDALRDLRIQRQIGRDGSGKIIGTPAEIGRRIPAEDLFCARGRALVGRGIARGAPSLRTWTPQCSTSRCGREPSARRASCSS